MIRDSRKDIEYFEGYFLDINTAINKSCDRIKKGLVPTDRISVSRIYYFKLCWQRCIAKYSAGFPLAELKLEVEELSSVFPEYWESSQSKVKLKGNIIIDSYYLEYYEIVLQLLSFAILLDVPIFLVKVANVLKRDNINDLLLNWLLKIDSELDENYPEDSIILSVYGDLRTAIKIQNSTEQELLVDHYLKNNFYNKHAGWYNSHNGRHAVYYGYWSFEAAAIFAMLGLDDRIFRDNQYYPKDLIDYYRSNKKSYPA